MRKIRHNPIPASAIAPHKPEPLELRRLIKLPLNLPMNFAFSGEIVATLIS